MSTGQVMLVPRSVDIAITGRCNLDCKYCFYADEMVALSDLPTERWLAFFDELGNLGIIEVTLTGGEVFSRGDLFDLIDAVVSNRMRYSLLTNGTLITERVLEKFNSGKRRQRLKSLQISVDGSTAEIHNLSRPNSFDRVIRALRLLVEARFPVTVRVTLNRHNVDDLENIARLLLEDIGLPSFSTNEAFPCGATNRAEGGIMLTPAQRLRAMKASVELAERYEGRILAQAGPLALARYFSDVDRLVAARETGMPGRGKLVGCGIASHQMAVLHDGTFVPCHQLSTLRMGTIGVDSLQDVWLNHPIMRAMRERRDIPLSSLDTCHDCQYQGFCTGGCPGGAIYFTGELNTRNPMDCYRVHKGEDPYFDLNADAPTRLDSTDAPRSV